VLARGGPAVLVLASPVEQAAADGAAAGTVTVHAGQVLQFALQWAPLSAAAPRHWDQSEIAGKLEATVAAWRGWSAAHQSYQGPWQQLVHHSGRVLQGLTHQPTGAIVAAPTTSLPEAVGGERNWDTATRGSATRRSPWTRCGWRPARTRRTSSSRS
jgi:GH15 family glucan-1,4-alpha-glucosidase